MSIHNIETAYHAPGAIIAETMKEGRALARMVAEVEAAIDPSLGDVARAVARMSEERRIDDPAYEALLADLIEGMDREIAAATREEVRTVERGWDENGPTYDTIEVQVIDPVAMPLVPVRDRAHAVADLLDRVRDLIAADAAMTALRRGRRR